MKKILVSAVLIAAAVSTQGCGKKDDGDSSGGGNPGGFVNKATESEFFGKGDSLKKMLDGGSRVALTENNSASRRNILQGGTFGALEAFASGSPRTSGNQSAGSECDFGQSSVNPSTSLPTASSKNSSSSKSGSAMYISENSSCAGALTAIKSQYSAVIQSLPKQIEALRNAGSIPESCGVKVHKLDPNSATEAVGYEFTLTQPNEKLDYNIQARGAADGDKVGLFFKMWLKGQSTPSAYEASAQSGPATFDANGEFNNVGDLANNSLTSNLSVNLAAAQNDVSLNVKVSQSVFAGGLGVNQLAGIFETMNMEFQATGAQGQSAAGDANLALTVKEITASQIELSANYAVNSGDAHQKGEYKMTMSRYTDGSCRVSAVSQK